MRELTIGLKTKAIMVIASKFVSPDFVLVPKTITMTPEKDIIRHIDSGIPNLSLRKQHARRAVTRGTMFELVEESTSGTLAIA